MALSVNTKSQQLLEGVFAAAPHAILMTGPLGIGLRTIAEEYARKSDKIIRIVQPIKDGVVNLEKGAHTIESIRNLYDETRLTEPKGRVVIIDDAERMATPAQNAFLKLLEEPTEGTVFILLAHAPEALLPTIKSRTQHVALRPVTAKQSEVILDELKIQDGTLRSQLLFVASGLPAQLTRLATDVAAFEARAAIIRDAREYTQGNQYKKLLLAKKYKDTRADALTLLEDAMKMVRTALLREQDQRLLARLDRLERLHQRLSAQGNVRLQLSAGIVV